MPILYVVATPIGNLGDMTPRAVETLKAVGLIAAEDTRVTQKLLNAFDIHTPLTSCHEHNERGKAAFIVQRMLTEGLDVAVVTDAGTPCVSDPGAALVAQAVAAGVEVVAVPGPTALAAALSVSGIEAQEFTFFGFLPRHKAQLREKLLDMARRSRVAVAHESPHRVAELLGEVESVLPHTRVSVSCDLTKKFEKTLRGPVAQVRQALEADPNAQKREYCVVFRWEAQDLAPPEPAPELGLEARLMGGLARGMSLRESMEALVASGERKNAVYAASLRLKALCAELAQQAPGEKSGA